MNIINTAIQNKKAIKQELNDIRNIQEMIKHLKTDEIKKVFLNNQEFNKTVRNILKQNKRIGA